tara:strand:+ start:215 stop:619 length:405 start_codon:yes stop_codon:yes gene_type:complete
MKNLAKLKFKTESQKGKQKPMFAAKTARAVPQLRKVAKALTGYKEGGTMTNPKAKDRLAQGSAARLEKALDKLLEEAPKSSMKEITIMMEGKRSGGVIRPKPTFKGKVLKPKPIKSRGIGIAIRGFGKAFKKGR